MKRRDVLATTGSVGIVATAGCATLGSTTISSPTENQDSDGETSLDFQTDDGKEVATLTVQPDSRRYDGAGGEQVSVDVALTHPDGTKVTDLTLSLRAPPSGAGTPTEIAFKTPFGTPHPQLDLYTDSDDAATVLAIDDMGEQGDGNMVFQFLLTGLGDTTSELAIDTEVGLAETGMLGQAYTLSGRTLVPLPAGTN